jgi:hypothetical protein
VVLAATQFWGLTGTEDTAIEVASMEVRASIGIGVSERERRRSSVQPSREGRPPRRRAPDLGITVVIITMVCTECECDAYRMNLEADARDVCVCGAPKAAHSAAALSAARRPSARLSLAAGAFAAAAPSATEPGSPGDAASPRASPRASISPRVSRSPRFLEEGSAEECCPCTAFKLNLTAASPGECVCGEPKVRTTLPRAMTRAAPTCAAAVCLVAGELPWPMP